MFRFKRHIFSVSEWKTVAVADPRGGGGPGPPTPVKTSQKKDGQHVGPQVSRDIGPLLGQISGSATE